MEFVDRQRIGSYAESGHVPSSDTPQSEDNRSNPSEDIVGFGHLVESG